MAPVDDLPQFLTDDRMWTTEIGFGGATPFSDGPGPHPFVLMQQSDSDTQTFRTPTDDHYINAMKPNVTP